ncbi:MAG: peptidase M24 [Gammaproteobacteria bacterium RIFCSPHIGHO2_12_FULL_38_11]|nr:MAG: peptidase M24 [Gammaproteobacteria bacterium RIFCSPHIGHO2_12_FULL_38_11]
MSEKLKKLRQFMREKNLDYYYVPTRDAHNNEYVPPHWERRAWLTDFTGSYGEAFIGMEKAFLWTDPRYYLQAEKQLNFTDFELMKQIQGVTAPIVHWLSDNVFNATIGFDPKLLSITEKRRWEDALAKIHGELTPVSENLVDWIWENRPPLKLEKIIILDEQYTGLSTDHKLKNLREQMKKIGADTVILSQLDEIAWIFNIRGDDIPYNPLVISYAIITINHATLFTKLDRVSEKDFPYFANQNIELKSYDAFEHALKNISGTAWVDPDTTSFWIASQLISAFLIEKKTPIAMMKAIKNKTELAGSREAHRLDAIAMIKFFCWLENNWKQGVDEISVADKLEALRRDNPRCKNLSFPTICGFADHGAIIHYQANEKDKYKIDDSNVLLIDSGGQYFEGTTDITRVIHLGKPTQEQKKNFTLVLKGHLALRHTPFPAGACGEHINTLARAPLWQHAMDFGHGTGHGVGAYLCVHEGPQRIGYGASGVPLQPGMIVSNEPGLYFKNQYGIRIENVCEIIEVVFAEKSPTDRSPFYQLIDLTVVPYAKNLIEPTLLTVDEIRYINEYHAYIYNLLKNDLTSDAREWLKKATDAI